MTDTPAGPMSASQPLTGDGLAAIKAQIACGVDAPVILRLVAEVERLRAQVESQRSQVEEGFARVAARTAREGRR